MKTIILGFLCALLAVSASAQTRSNPLTEPTPLKKITGYFNIVWGSDEVRAPNLIGSFNLCLGHGTCPKLSTENCVVDIVEPNDNDIMISANPRIGNMTYAIALAKFMDEQCKDGKDRSGKTYNWFSKIIVMQVHIQQENLDEAQKKAEENSQQK